MVSTTLKLVCLFNSVDVESKAVIAISLNDHSASLHKAGFSEH